MDNVTNKTTAAKISRLTAAHGQELADVCREWCGEHYRADYTDEQLLASMVDVAAIWEQEDRADRAMGLSRGEQIEASLDL